MTDLAQTSSEATRSWSSSPLIVSRDSFSHQTWARFQPGGALPALSGCHYIYFCYIIFIIYALRVSIFITSSLGVAVGLYKEVYLRIFKRVSFWLHGCCVKWEGWARKPVNHTSLVAVVTLTDRPKSVRNRCVIELFVALFVLSLCPFDISVGVGVFVIGMIQNSSFFSYYTNFETVTNLDLITELDFLPNCARFQ